MIKPDSIIYSGFSVIRPIKSTIGSPEPDLTALILDKALELNDFEVPQKLLDEEINSLITEYNYNLKYRTMFSGESEPLADEERSQQLIQIKQTAYKRIKTDLLLKAIIETENLDVSREELNVEGRAVAQRQNVTFDMVCDFFGEDLGMLRGDLLMRKALDLLVSGAVIITTESPS